MLLHSPTTDRLPEEQRLGDFAQVLTHRIRNLLASIEGFTDLLTDTLGSREQRELALRILESTARIEFVLDDLQYYSQPVQMATIPVRVQDVMDRLLATLEEDHRRRLMLDIEQPHGTVLTDPSLLRQALLTLIQNAFDATSLDRHVALHVAFDTDTVRFTVSNQGTIDLDEAAHKVFEPFSRPRRKTWASAWRWPAASPKPTAGRSIWPPTTGSKAPASPSNYPCPPRPTF